MLQPTVAKIRLDHLRHNLRTLRQQVNDDLFFCPMVKADAYGHGAVQVSKVLIDENVSYLGVTRIEEAQELRSAGFSAVNILLFDPLIDESAAQTIVNERITPVVSNWDSLQVLLKAAVRHPISVHIKLNTGMNRLGFQLGDALAISDFFKSNTQLKLEGLCSHLLSSEDYGTDGSRTKNQIERFNSVLPVFSGLKLKIHLLNSGGIIALASHREKNTILGARPGLSLYGIKAPLLTDDSEVQARWASIELKPVMQVESVVSHIQKIAKGQTVSYGGQFIAERDSTIVVLPIGYADGYTRHFSNKGKMLFRGHEVGVSGIVCMDFTMLDVTELDKLNACRLGEPVIVLGEQDQRKLTALDLAGRINTNAYEILTNFSSRIPRVYT
ncbi:MAG: alanine racemase [Bdellovibrionales bacterium]|nr:alanine racemase [Bdellovibrionales bacterium]